MSLLNIIVPFVPDCNNSLATVGTKVRDMQERRTKKKKFSNYRIANAVLT